MPHKKGKSNHAQERAARIKKLQKLGPVAPTKVNNYHCSNKTTIASPSSLHTKEIIRMKNVPVVSKSETLKPTLKTKKREVQNSVPAINGKSAPGAAKPVVTSKKKEKFPVIKNTGKKKK